MLFFRKNKRQFGYRSHRRVFVALFLFALLSTTAISLFFNAKAEGGPVASVRFDSNHASFDSVDPGAWKVTKSAEWTGVGKARITFEVTSRSVVEEKKPKDVVMVFDVSGSMQGDKLARVKSDTLELASSLLEDPDNRIALISFSAEAQLLERFTDNEENIQNRINHLTAYDSTNYGAAFSKVNELMSIYGQSDNRSLIVLFLTDGYPNDGQDGIAEYRILKANYPKSTVHGIQYEMGERILQPIIKVSDYQHVANINTLNNVLFKAAFATELYTNFVLTDCINDSYWTINGSNSISASLGSTSLNYDGSTPQIIWDMSNKYRSGNVETLTIDVELKSEYLDDLEQLLPTNKHTAIASSIRGADDENIDESTTPILINAYEVRYFTNAPSGCENPGAVPEPTKHSIYSSVEKFTNDLSCPGYNFLGWEFKTHDVQKINDDHFIMPANDVEIVAIWGKPDISKSLEGQSHTRADATFDVGVEVNRKMRALSGETEIDTEHTSETKNNSITAFVRTEILSNAVDRNDDKYVLSAADSPVKIYGWFNNGIIYYYSDADDLYLNEDASQMFFSLNKLSDINSLRYIHTDRTTNMESMFCAWSSFYTNLDPLETWDVSNVTNMESMFDQMSGNVIDSSGISDWNVSNVTNLSWFYNSQKDTNLKTFENWNTSNVIEMKGTFWGMRELTSLEGIEGWDVSKVTSMRQMFENAADKLHDIDELSEWDTESLVDTSWMFASEAGYPWPHEGNYGFYNIDGLADWNIQNLEVTRGMFSGMNNLQDISALSNWEPHKLTDIGEMFDGADIPNVEPLKDWDISSVQYMDYMFYGNQRIAEVGHYETDEETGEQVLVGGVSQWDTSNVIDMSGVFSQCTGLADISGVKNWITSNAKYMNNLFYGNAITNVDALSGWDVSKVEEMWQMFGSSSVADIEGISGWQTTSLKNVHYMFSETKITNVGHYETDEETGEDILTGGLSQWDMSHVVDFEGMFNQSRLRNIDGVKNWVMSSATTIEGIFYQDNLVSIDPVENWDVSNVKKMGWVFDGARATSISVLDKWKDKIGNVEEMQHMFSDMSRLESLDGLQNWDTSKVTTMMCMFDFSTALHDISPLENWHVENVKTMSYMFRGSGIYNVDAMATWHPNSLTAMQSMFFEAASLTNIDGISGWFNNAETSTLTNLENTFASTPLTNLNALANWKTPKLTNMKNTFNNMTSLTNVDGLENWDTSKVTAMEGLFSGDTAFTNPDAFDKINVWNTTRVSNMADAFLNVPTEITRPTWYSED